MGTRARRAPQVSTTVSRLLGMIERVPDDPFYTPRRPLYLPRALAVAPALDPLAAAGSRWSGATRC